MANLNPAYMTMQPIGHAPLTWKQRIVFFIDIHNISVRTITLLSGLFGAMLAAGLTLLLAVLWRRSRRK